MTSTSMTRCNFIPSLLPQSLLRARTSVVLIPKREIEAWLLYDARAIAMAFHENLRPRLPGNPGSLQDPKKHLRDVIRKKYRRDYLHTVHNCLIAKQINPSLLVRSGSFTPHFEFAATVRGTFK